MGSEVGAVAGLEHRVGEDDFSHYPVLRGIRCSPLMYLRTIGVAVFQGNITHLQEIKGIISVIFCLPLAPRPEKLLTI